MLTLKGFWQDGCIGVVGESSIALILQLSVVIFQPDWPKVLVCQLTGQVPFAQTAVQFEFLGLLSPGTRLESAWPPARR